MKNIKGSNSGLDVDGQGLRNEVFIAKNVFLLILLFFTNPAFSYCFEFVNRFSLAPSWKITENTKNLT